MGVPGPALLCSVGTETKHFLNRPANTVDLWVAHEWCHLNNHQLSLLFVCILLMWIKLTESSLGKLSVLNRWLRFTSRAARIACLSARSSEGSRREGASAWGPAFLEGLSSSAYVLHIFSQEGIGSSILRASVTESGKRKMVRTPVFYGKH